MSARDIVTVRPAILLPERVQRQAEEEQLQELDTQVQNKWRTGAQISFVATLALMMLNVTAIGVAHKYGITWALLPYCLSVIPLLWLASKAMFTYPSAPQLPPDDRVELPEDWRTP